MELLEAIRARKSCRSYVDEPIDKQLVESVLNDAKHAPSAINMQPWELNVVLNEERKLLSRRLLKSYREMQVTCGPGSSKPIPDTFMQRSRDCATGMTPLIEKMGSDFKTYINEGSLDFYGAPAVVLIFLDEVFPPDRMVDAGSLVAYLVLSAAGHGLGSCPIGLVTGYEDEIKDHLNVPESKKLVLSVAMGIPDPDAAINEFRAPRAELKEFVRWVD